MNEMVLDSQPNLTGDNISDEVKPKPTLFNRPRRSNSYPLHWAVLKAIGFLPPTSIYDDIEREVKELNLPKESFLRYVPVYDFDNKTKTFRCYDSDVVGFVFDISSVDVEGLLDIDKETIRERVQNTLDSIHPKADSHRWVIQTYTQEEDYQIRDVIATMKNHAKSNNAYSSLTKDYLKQMKTFIKRASRKGGYFIDPRNNARWGIKKTITRFVVYRDYGYQKWPDRNGRMPEDLVKDKAVTMRKSLNKMGIKARFVTASGLKKWLIPFFNPGQDLNTVNTMCEQTKPNEERRMNSDLGRELIYSKPFIDPDQQNCFVMDGYYYRIIPVDTLLHKPRVGHFTVDQKVGDTTHQLFKSLPEDSILCTNVLLESRTDILNLLEKRRSQISALTPDRNDYLDEIDLIQNNVSSGAKMGSISVAVILRAKTFEELEVKTTDCLSVLTIGDFLPHDPRLDINHEQNLTSFVNHLPFAFSEQNKVSLDMTQYWYMEDITAMIPLYGRSKGTDCPTITLFNRDGELVQYCPISNRKNNSHSIVVGPSGSGKSATSGNFIVQLMAMVRPRQYIIDYGGSYEFVAEYAKEMGLKVKVYDMKLTNDDIALPPFSEAVVYVVGQDHPRFEKERDYLSDMSFIGRIIATGGNANEERAYTLQHNAVLQNAIILAAIDTIEDGRDQTMISDVILALRDISSKEGPSSTLEKYRNSDVYREYADHERHIASHLANNIEAFIRTEVGRIFNRPYSEEELNDNTDYDLVLYEMGVLAESEQNEPWLMVAFMTYFLRFNQDLPKHRLSGRKTILHIEEAHKYTKNRIIIPFLNGASRVVRKLGGILSIYTQTLGDFDAAVSGGDSTELEKAARSMLDQFEWWYTLSLEDNINEATYIQKYKKLNDTQASRLISATKQPGYYVEAGITSKSVNGVFQIVMPGKYMAMAYTEPDERKLIRDIGIKNEVSDYEATKILGEQIEKDRQVHFGRSFVDDMFGELVV